MLLALQGVKEKTKILEEEIIWIWHWIKVRWVYFLKNAWCKLGIKWTRNTKATTCIGEIERDGTFKTCIYIIQWNLLKVHQPLKKFHQLNLLLTFTKSPFSNFSRPHLLKTSPNFVFYELPPIH
jgi:hypothetical protein